MRQTPKYLHTAIKMRLVDKSVEWDGPLQHGDFFWRFKDGNRTLVVAVPINANLRPLLTEWTIDHENHCGAQWRWDGNETEPTLTPSLHAEGIWHGYVRKGMLVEA